MYILYIFVQFRFIVYRHCVTQTPEHILILDEMYIAFLKWRIKLY